MGAWWQLEVLCSSGFNEGIAVYLEWNKKKERSKLGCWTSWASSGLMERPCLRPLLIHIACYRLMLFKDVSETNKSKFWEAICFFDPLYYDYIWILTWFTFHICKLWNILTRVSGGALCCRVHSRGGERERDQAWIFSWQLWDREREGSGLEI